MMIFHFHMECIYLGHSVTKFAFYHFLVFLYLICAKCALDPGTEFKGEQGVMSPNFGQGMIQYLLSPPIFCDKNVLVQSSWLDHC